MRPIGFSWIAPAFGCAAFFTAAGALADWTESTVSVSSSSMDQHRPTLVTDASGGAFVFWLEAERHPVGIRLDSSGLAALGWPTTGTWLPPGSRHYANGIDAIPDGAGGAYLVHDWPWDLQPLSVMRITPQGAMAAGWPANLSRYDGSPSRGDGPNAILKGPEEIVPWIAADVGHGPVVAWWSINMRGTDETMASGYDSEGRFLAGWTDTRRVRTWGGKPTVCSDGEGGAFVAWAERQHSSPYPSAVLVRHFLSSGESNPQWPSGADVGLQLSEYLTGLDGVRIVSAGLEGALVAWHEPGTSGQAMRIQKLTRDGSIADGWPAGGIVVAAGSTRPAVSRAARGTQWFYAAMIADERGGAYLCWIDHRDDPDGDLYVQHILGNGTVAAGWPEGGARIAGGPGLQGKPALAADDEGGALVAWEDRGSDPNGDVLVQKLSFEGVIANTWPEGGIACDREGAQSSPAVVHDGRGGAIVVWSQPRDSVENLYARRFVGDRSTPVLASLVRAEAFPDRVHLAWQLGGTPAVSEVVLERSEGAEWRERAVLRVDGVDRASYEDRDVTPGSRLGYRIRAGGESAIGETWVDIPLGAEFALADVVPNPSSGRTQVRLSLADASPARLELLDVTGRLILARDVGALGPGRHTVSLDIGTAVPAGLYWLRLSRADRQLSRRLVVAR